MWFYYFMIDSIIDEEKKKKKQSPNEIIVVESKQNIKTNEYFDMGYTNYDALAKKKIIK